MTTEFVHLHTHSDYSMLDGACKIKNLADLASKNEMKALALTDHGNLCGAIEFYTTMKKSGIKPIIGCECYLAPRGREERNQSHPHHKGYHQILYARDFEGYQNLCRLNAKSYLEGFYFKPRIDKEILSEFSKGLLGTSSCIGGEIPSFILEGKLEEARKSLASFTDILGKENFYLELQDHGMQEQIKVNKELIKLSKEFDLPLIATNDIHYLQREHALAHEVLLCIGTQKTMQDSNRMQFPAPEFYFKTGEEMAELFKEFPQSLSNTLEVTEKCNLELELDGVNHYPIFHPPDHSDRKTYLRNLCVKGLRNRYHFEVNGQSKEQLPESERKILDRMDYEIDVIDQMGFSSYFLVVWDFLRFAREKGIPIGPGRGSGAGSIVAYLLKITDIDPLRYNLLFERFLNPDRVSPPDFDIDLCERRRYEVIDYVRSKYGDDSVAQIGTFGTLKAKAVIKDVTRAIGRPFDDGLRLTKMIPADPKMNLEKAIGENTELKSMLDTEKWVDEVFKFSRPLEGLNRNMSIHAAGVIIGDQPLTNLVPLARGQGNEIITQYPAGPCEALGLLKLDFLGLRTLTIIQDTCDHIERGSGKKIDPGAIPLDDGKTYDLIKEGNTVSVFQLESGGMRDLCRRFGVEKLEHIIALIALFRPGPMQFLDEFISRKMGKKKVEYDLPSMKPILEETFGIMLYQEQVMQVVQSVAGFTLAQADILRRAMGKKKPEEMKAQLERFVEGCKANGISEDKAKAIFEKIEMFAGYGFNKSHSAAYAMIAYQTAYFKANYPVEFMCANLSCEMHSAERVSYLISECKTMGIKVLPPDVNHSLLTFTVDKQAIRFGLAAIKGVGSAAANAIIESRKSGPFASLFEFYERVAGSISRRIMESLSQCGAFDCFQLARAQMFEMVENVIARAQTYIEDRQKGQANFFDLLEDPETSNSDQVEIPDIPEWEPKKMLQFEKELLGFYVTGHPLDEFTDEMSTFGLQRIADINVSPQDQEGVRIGGIVASLTIKHSKKDGSPWAIMDLEDLSGSIECLVYSKTYAEYAMVIAAEAVVFVEGYISLRDGENIPKIIVSKIVPCSEAPSTYTKEIHVRIYQDQVKEAQFKELQEIIKAHPGKSDVILSLVCNTKEKAFVRAGSKFSIEFSKTLKDKVENLFGDKSILVKPDTTKPKRERPKWEKNGEGQGNSFG